MIHASKSLFYYLLFLEGRAGVTLVNKKKQTEEGRLLNNKFAYTVNWCQDS